MTTARTEVREYVHDHPGVHFNALVESLDQATGQVQHHVYRLVRDGDLEAASLYGRTHYYPEGFDDGEKETIALLRRETTRDLLVALLDGDGRRPAALADELGVARSTLEYHLDRLVECGVVEKRRDDRGRVTLHLATPEEVARLLAAVEPSVADRFVDRFTRLVDDFLEDAGGPR